MVKRNLSGVYFRSKNEDTGKFENVVFEDLSEKEQNHILDQKDVIWLRSLVIQLSRTVREIGDQFDIVKEH